VPASISPTELYSDRTVSAMLGVSGDELEIAVDNAIEAASDRGILLVAGDHNGENHIYLNTEPVRRALVRQGIDLTTTDRSTKRPETWPDTDAAKPKLNAINFYEQNIAPVTPVVAENIHAALEEHSEDEVLLAIRNAAEANVRSWNYIAAILRRWATEGRPEELDDEGDGTTRRDLQKDRSDEYYEEYLKRQRARGAN
jgi:DnaD/phage-associated family protein